MICGAVQTSIHIRTECTSVAEDSNPYECGRSYDNVINKLDMIIKKIFDCFCNNNLKANASKCHFFSHHTK